MVALMQSALTAQGIEDEVVAVGEFYPRGHTGGLFAGGMIGGDAGGVLGGVAEGVGVAAGSIAGMRGVDAASGLPERMLVGVTAEHVYGFAEHSRRDEPSQVVFQVPRAGLTVKVHQRVNVRVLELIDEASGSQIELEGNRLPITHSKDVIDLLNG
jgi:hypothetical protein